MCHWVFSEFFPKAVQGRGLRVVSRPPLLSFLLGLPWKRGPSKLEGLLLDMSYVIWGPSAAWKCRAPSLKIIQNFGYTKCSVSVKWNIIHPWKGRKSSHMLQHRWTMVSETRHKRANVVRFHLHETPGEVKSMETKWNVGARGWGRGWGASV